jgi:hypothetical protein
MNKYMTCLRKEHREQLSDDIEKEDYVDTDEERWRGFLMHAKVTSFQMLPISSMNISSAFCI